MIVEKSSIKKHMRFTLLTYIVLFVMMSSCAKKSHPTSTTEAASKEVRTNNMVADILFYVNKHRTSIGRQPLQLIDVANSQAAKHSYDMATRKAGFGHGGFESRVTVIAKSLGSVSAAAENVAYGNLTAQQVVDGWLHSSGHKKNMEGNYTFTGIGVAKDNSGVIFFTQIFVRK
jgi:uncharacterized protein YkwD